MNTYQLNKPFWILWMVEFWERFGYYGATAILVLYFIKDLGYDESESYYLFGAFTAMVYGFVWVGGWLGDVYLGSKRTLMLGSVILACAYLALTFANRDLIFYALAGIVVGNALFKANPAALISKMYTREDPAFVSAMTFYYVAVNLGALCSMAITPMIMQQVGVSHAFGVSALGLIVGLSLFTYHASALNHLHHDVGRKPLSLNRLGVVLLGCVCAVILIAQCLMHPL
ncbi:MAG: oligopeptide:H+ symporter, partial [Methylococcales bacterium]|nr:oligopeptide:H+ symporter [Methylococcales bacterium]